MWHYLKPPPPRLRSRLPLPPRFLASMRGGGGEGINSPTFNNVDNNNALIISLDAVPLWTYMHAAYQQSIEYRPIFHIGSIG